MGTELITYIGYIVGGCSFQRYYLDSEEEYECPICDKLIKTQTGFTNGNLKAICHKCMNKLVEDKVKTTD